MAQTTLPRCTQGSLIVIRLPKFGNAASTTMPISKAHKAHITLFNMPNLQQLLTHFPALFKNPIFNSRVKMLELQPISRSLSPKCMKRKKSENRTCTTDGTLVCIQPSVYKVMPTTQIYMHNNTTSYHSYISSHTSLFPLGRNYPSRNLFKCSIHCIYLDGSAGT